MSKAILHCEKCGTYTLKSACACGTSTKTVIPPKYSPDDRHAHLTRQAKETERKAKGLL